MRIMNATTGLTQNGTQARLSTRQALVKVANVPCLYRHSLNGTYYAIKKLKGEKKQHSLDTTDRKIAERRLKTWLANLDKLDSTAEKTTLEKLLTKFAESRAGLADKTVQTETWLANTFRETWGYGMDLRVSQVRPSMLDTWLSQHEARLKNSSYNRFTLFLKGLFELAEKDRMIVAAENPYSLIRKPWKAPRKTAKKRIVPTDAQFAAIVTNIRAETQNVHAKESANFIEFMGLAGLGQAEACSLTWGNVHWNKGPRGEMSVRRKKTGESFDVPLYLRLKPFLQQMYQDAHKDGNPPTPEAKLFSICDARKALTHACTRLGFPAFTQRSIRAYLIQTSSISAPRQM
jgi:integrase